MLYNVYIYDRKRSFVKTQMFLQLAASLQHNKEEKAR